MANQATMLRGGKARKGKRALLRAFALQGFIFFISGYFIVHAMGLIGERGFLTLFEVDTEIEEAEQKLKDLKAESAALSHRIALISEDKIDADLLGEIARKQGGLFAEDEILLSWD